MLPTRTSRLRLSLALALILASIAPARSEDDNPPEKVLPPVGSVCTSMDPPPIFIKNPLVVRCIYPDGSEWHCTSDMTACVRKARRVETDHGLENQAAGSPMAPTSSTLLSASDLAISDLADTSLRLTWQDNSNNEDGFIVERTTASERGEISKDWSALVKKRDRRESRVRGTGDRSWIDRTLTPGTRYCYRVRAFKGRVEAKNSEVACAIAGEER